MFGLLQEYSANPENGQLQSGQEHIWLHREYFNRKNRLSCSSGRAQLQLYIPAHFQRQKRPTLSNPLRHRPSKHELKAYFLKNQNTFKNVFILIN
jgi:hypothetical protein